MGISTGTESSFRNIMPYAGTFSDFRVTLTNNTAGTTVTSGKIFTVLNNGNTTSVNLTILDGGKTGSSHATTYFAQGESLSIMADNTGSHPRENLDAKWTALYTS